ncbi:metallophosphoesterase family protein [Lapillicoccus jejuensis]|uniref:3',5'-cyclic AMP phosphodiesterase CpdA n=1 Tax=Lapillicoccus jejuensis TaxID=402171 RepID=A0A542DZS8_9MICO|nr:metallophosphoesterase [Lapillicoccus jejuensis]TQJ08573.1 3',5'-cyclic AMP phosphodiesterase CpdA [Lapillicoccus jejuensis]
MRTPSRAHAVRGVLLGAKVVRWLTVLAACYLGGVAATNLSPTTVETRNYSATLRLNALPSRVGVLHSPTIVGDVDLQFASPALAPGLEVDVAVKQSITQVFSSRELAIAELQPSQEELRAAVLEAASGVGLRFVTGAGVVGLAILLALHYSRDRHRSDRRHVVVVTSAALVGCLATAVGVVATYRPTSFTSYRTSGLLLEVERNRGILSDLSTRSSQVTPYVLNLLALSKSLQENLVPSDLDQEVAARFLLVSDVHGQNSYGLMRSIVQSQHIDAVIDTGDLVNFGTVTEADAAGIFAGIRDLGVPYVFTTGNHDQSSPTDRALRDRLDDLPNVVTLQPSDDEYRTLLFHGLRIAGFDDPRYFGDDARNTDAKQKPAVDDFNRSMADQPTPDVLVAHEPGAAAGVDKADVRINGHLHQAGLDGDRITVGTFTGGGVVSHYVEEPDGELRGQPYAFDIAAFDTSCKLSSLTRYEYRDLVEGNPVYDSVTVVNGSTIETASPGLDPATGKARTCSASDPTDRLVVPLVKADTPSDGSTTGN